MRRLTLFLLTLLVLVGCAPVLSPTLQRDADTITVVVTANADAYEVTLQVLEATTEDSRCGPIGPDFACVLGDILADESVIVSGTATGTVHCVAFGFSNESRSINSYRPYPCKVIGG